MPQSDAPPLPPGWRPPPGPVFVLSGAGLSQASGIPTYRGRDGLWRGFSLEELATPRAFAERPDEVRAFYDQRRAGVLAALPNAGHLALVRLAASMEARRVSLVTQNVDGLLDRAAETLGLAPCALEMHGSLLRLRCRDELGHPELQPWPGTPSPCQDPAIRCAECGAPLRPAVVWFGETPSHLLAIHRLALRCRTFLSVGTSGQVYPAAGLIELARRAGAVCIELNPEPTGGDADFLVAEGAETALPRLVDSWLDGR